MARKDTARIIAPPPLLFFLCLGTAWAADRLLPAPLPEMPVVPRVVTTLSLIALSCAVGAVAFLTFRAHKTPVNPYAPTLTVVSRGPYRFSRNPLYVVLLVTYAGFTLLLDTWWAAGLLPLLALLLHFGVVKREEVYLEEKFGELYRRYKKSVRRWL
jgi:protein-S-isoprenylcysteine O-methyltransferase Ste14